MSLRLKGINKQRLQIGGSILDSALELLSILHRLRHLEHMMLQSLVTVFDFWRFALNTAENKIP